MAIKWNTKTIRHEDKYKFFDLVSEIEHTLNELEKSKCEIFSIQSVRHGTQEHTVIYYKYDSAAAEIKK